MDQFLNVSSRILGILAIVSLAYPLWQCWRRQRCTSLRHALLWFAAAWAGWVLALVAPWLDLPAAPMRYLALCLASCFLVAVLGARQPGMAAWNFVVAGLLAILLLPLAEQPWRSPNWHVDGPRSLFLAGILAVGILNYLPTRWILTAAAGGAWAGMELWSLAQAPPSATHLVLPILFAALLWSAIDRPQAQPAGELDTHWLAFRDSYGLVWGLRVQEQFNNAAEHAGHSARLKWKGLGWPGEAPPPDENLRRELLATLQAVLKRFNAPDRG